MPFGIGPLELIVVLVIILVIFGPKRLPQAGRSLGQGLREFKDSVTGKDGDSASQDAGQATRDASELPPSSQPAESPAATTATPDEASRAFGRED